LPAGVTRDLREFTKNWDPKRDFADQEPPPGREITASGGRFLGRLQERRNGGLAAKAS
jgi:hypothetical protein